MRGSYTSCATRAVVGSDRSVRGEVGLLELVAVPRPLDGISEACKEAFWCAEVDFAKVFMGCLQRCSDRRGAGAVLFCVPLASQTATTCFICGFS